MCDLITYNDGGRVVILVLFDHWFTLWDAPRWKRRREARRRPSVL